MDGLTDLVLDAALERGRVAAGAEPRARAVRYDAAARLIVVTLTNGCLFAFPPDLAQGLGGASEEALAEGEVLGTGYGLHWETLDVDLAVPALLAGLFGTKAWMAAHAGRATSEAKAQAARANGAKGGRPRKVVPGQTAG